MLHTWLVPTQASQDTPPHHCSVALLLAQAEGGWQAGESRASCRCQVQPQLAHLCLPGRLASFCIAPVIDEGLKCAQHVLLHNMLDQIAGGEDFSSARLRQAW